MTLTEILSAEAGGSRRGILVAASLAGIANALILFTINSLAHDPSAALVREFVIFALLVALYVHCTRYLTHSAAALLESALHRIKVRVGERVARAELDAFERVKAAEISDRITQNTSLIADMAGMLSTMLQSIPILAFALVYIAWLSLPAFALVALLGGIGLVMFLGLRQDFVASVRQSGGIRVTFFERITDLLSGFKEVKLSRRRGRELRDDTVQASDALRAILVQGNQLRSDGNILGESILFALLAVTVYTLHAQVALSSLTMTQLVAAVMFTWAPFMGIASGLMPYIRSNLALAEIDALEQKLEGVVRVGGASRKAEDPWQGKLSTIEARGVEFAHAADDGGEAFRIGPIDFALSSGEVVFIVGGNGSGKSTLLKVLTGLYPARSGTLLVDGVLVGPDNVAAYRDMISAIFADFHLFAKLYGLPEVEDAAVHGLIARMQLEGKTSFADRSFTNIALSTGQKKRVAMIVALLEDRPFCVFDEWAADQDPEFRKYFYDELLPLLRQQGKAVLVVSHDDRYFHCADRVVTMEYGKVRSVVASAPVAVTA